MICLKRSILQHDFIVFIEEMLYIKHSGIFDCIFSTFSRVDANREIPFNNCMYIYSQFETNAGDSAYCMTGYCFLCDESNNLWILALKGELEEWYAGILNCTIIHGACVTLNGANLLLVGERKTGKTTLTKYLVYEKKARYLDDDCVYFINGEYLGFNMPIPVRQAYPDSFDSNAICRTYDGEKVARVLYKPLLTVPKLSKIDRIIFPQFNSHGSNQLRSLKASELYCKFLNNIRNSADVKSLFSDIHKIIHDAEAYHIVYTSSEKAFDIITSIL